MMFTTEELRLLYLYLSGSAGETATVVREALTDISEPELRNAAESILRKLDSMDEAAFDRFIAESGVTYAG